MQKGIVSSTGAGLACISLLLAGCGEMNVTKYLSIGGDGFKERTRTPANAVEYQCAAGKRFHVRTLEGGAAVWLMLPERELRLDRLGEGAGSRYSKGNTVLEINGNAATLTDGATATFRDCKLPQPSAAQAPAAG